MDFSIIASLIVGFTGIFSLISSIINFNITKKDMKTKIKMTNHDLLEFEMDDINSEKVTNISLNKICKFTVSYFEKISKENYFKVNIFKINNSNRIIQVSSSSDIKNEFQYRIDANTEFNEAATTLKPYYKNNISYYHKRGNEYVSENKDWNKQYQSIICYPITKNEKIYGFLTVEIRNPLNDLIDINEIVKFLKLECALISVNKEFNNFSETDNNIEITDSKNINSIDNLQQCYQCKETIDMSDNDKKDDNTQ